MRLFNDYCVGRDASVPEGAVPIFGSLGISYTSELSCSKAGASSTHVSQETKTAGASIGHASAESYALDRLNCRFDHNETVAYGNLKYYRAANADVTATFDIDWFLSRLK